MTNVTAEVHSGIYCNTGLKVRRFGVEEFDRSENLSVKIATSIVARAYYRCCNKYTRTKGIVLNGNLHNLRS